jgi:hypothetical protein
MKAPFGLDLGLHLEKSNVILRWGSTFESLRRIGKPKVSHSSREARSSLEWEKETVFGGLKVCVQMDQYSPDCFFLCQDFLDQAYIAAISDKKAYDTYLAELSQRLGSPHLQNIDSEGYPAARWLWAHTEVSLAVGERFFGATVCSKLYSYRDEKRDREASAYLERIEAQLEADSFVRRWKQFPMEWPHS